MQRPHPIDVLPSPLLIRAALATFSIFHSYLSPASPVSLHNARIRSLFRPSLYVTFPTVILFIFPPHSLPFIPLPARAQSFPAPVSSAPRPPQPVRCCPAPSAPFSGAFSLFRTFRLLLIPHLSRLRTHANPPPPVPSPPPPPSRVVPAIQTELELATSSLISSSSSEAGYAARMRMLP
ncbi:hypothetical protein DFH09DRAFT_1335535 [Mycena vulgaris]|nr:hypothetical protein DFH09DRAFT_1335535 [Mycena vulgaris]